jgi:hypothetical protein
MGYSTMLYVGLDVKLLQVLFMTGLPLARI